MFPPVSLLIFDIFSVCVQLGRLLHFNCLIVLQNSYCSEEANKVQDQVWWKNEIEEELYEIREEFEEEYKDKLVIYNEQVLAVEKQKEEKVWQTVLFIISYTVF